MRDCQGPVPLQPLMPSLQGVSQAPQSLQEGQGQGPHGGVAGDAVERIKHSISYVGTAMAFESSGAVSCPLLRPYMYRMPTRSIFQSRRCFA